MPRITRVAYRQVIIPLAAAVSTLAACATRRSTAAQPSHLDASADAARPASTLCSPTAFDTTRATRVAFGDYSLAIPRGFARVRSESELVLYEFGEQQIGIVVGNHPHLFATAGAAGPTVSQRTLSMCPVTIDSVPAEIALMSVLSRHRGVGPPERLGDLRGGGRLIIAARFSGAAQGRDLVVYFSAVDRRTVERHAGVLWTVRFGKVRTQPS